MMNFPPIQENPSMSEKPVRSDAKTQVQRHLHALSHLLRAAHRLSPEAQALLADLVDELAHALESEEVSQDDVAHVTESTSHLVQAVHVRDIVLRHFLRFERV